MEDATGKWITLSEELKKGRPIIFSFSTEENGVHFVICNYKPMNASYGDDSFELPVSATYVIDQNSRIIAGVSDINHRTRMEPSETLEIVKSL